MLTKPLSAVTAETMEACGVTASLTVEGGMAVVSPVTGQGVATLATHDVADTEAAIKTKPDPTAAGSGSGYDPKTQDQPSHATPRHGTPLRTIKQ